MPRAPHALDYEAPARQPKPLGQKVPSTWDKLGAGLRIVFGFPFLVLGIYALFALATGGRPHLWKENLFVGVFAGLAGLVATVRPLYRMIRGGTWWNLD